MEPYGRERKSQDMEAAWEMTKTALDFIFGHLFIWNMIFAVIIVFFQRRDPKSVWAWLLLLVFIPILGFVFYLVRTETGVAA